MDPDPATEEDPDPMHVAGPRPSLPPAPSRLPPPRPAGGAAPPTAPAAAPGWYAGAYFRLLAWATAFRPGDASPAASPPPTRPGGFVEAFGDLDERRWRRSGPWANGDVFACGWRKDHATVDGGQLVLRISDAPTAGAPYAGGEVATSAPIRYGRVEASMKPIRAPGVITSLFTYTGPSEGRRHHEIDVEFLGDDTTKVQLGYFTDGKHYATEVVDLGFDAAAGFHTYGFEWGPKGITWFVDGKPVKHADGAQGPLPSEPQRVFANAWPTRGADGWAGRFQYAGRPLEARYDWIAVSPAAA